MCGIAGWLGPSGLDQAPEAVARVMLDRIAHRGPDGRGTAVLPHGGMFGHLRLAIIDPVGGAQPVYSRDGRSVLVFNGEIFNFRALRERLSGAGIEWRTESDSEVLLELLQREGPDALGDVRGMYAFAFWDGHRQRALLARDPGGIKPLFLRVEGGTLWFASEAKAFPRTPRWRPSLDPAQLHLLLNLRYPAGGAGLMQGVRQLPPGHCLEWTPTAMREWRIASPAAAPIDATGVHDAVVDSVRAHLVADVPVASYLSGGIDSGIVTMAAAQLSPGHIESFTIDAGDDPREAANAAETARWLGIPNHAAALAPAGLDVLTWLLWHLEVPKVNALQSAAVAQLAARQVKVVLSGLGGDELFLGYRAHRHFAQAMRVGGALGPLAAPMARLLCGLLPNAAQFGEPWRAAAMLGGGGDNGAAAYALLRNVWDGALPREQVYGPRMLDAALPDARGWVAQRWPQDATPLEAMARFEWDNKMVDDLLWQEDRTSMAAGLEVRVPFVDEPLRRALQPLLRESARHPGKKRLLRQAFAAQVPPGLLQRPKSGFQIDIASQLDALFGAALDAWLAPDQVRRHGLFDPGYVARLRALPRTRAHRWHFFLLLLMAQAHRWLELFESGEVAPPPRPVLTRVAA